MAEANCPLTPALPLLFTVIDSFAGHLDAQPRPHFSTLLGTGRGLVPTLWPTGGEQKGPPPSLFLCPRGWTSDVGRASFALLCGWEQYPGRTERQDEESGP